MGELRINKTKFFIVLSIIVLFLVFSFWQVIIKSFESGYNDGNYNGYNLGNKEGFQTGKKVGDSIGYHRGDSLGFTRGFDSKYEDILKIEEVFKNLKYKFQPSIYHSRIIDNVASITAYNSDGTFQNFSEIMNSINTELLEFLSNNFELSSSDRNYILASYQKQSKELNHKAYQHLVDLNKQNYTANNQTIFTRKNIDGLNNFDKILGGYICDVVGIFIGGIAENPYSDFFVHAGTKTICPYVTSYAIKPYLIELKKQAVIKDYSESEIKIEKQISSQIAEFVTAEVKTSSYDRFDYTKKILWGTSTATVKTNSKAITKAGFDLMKKFELKIDHSLQEIILQFPAPKITSHEVNTQYRNIDEGWFVKIKENELNDINYTITNDLRNQAWDDTSLYYDAISNAEDLLKIIFGPISTSMPYPYTVKVRFGNGIEKTLIDHSNLQLDIELSKSNLKW